MTSKPKVKYSSFKTDDDTKRRLVHTLAHAIVFIVSICCPRTSGPCRNIFAPLFSKGQANQSQAGPSCDEFELLEFAAWQVLHFEDVGRDDGALATESQAEP